MANEIVKSFGEQFTDKLIAVEDALPKDFNRARYVQNCLSVLNEKSELAKINKAQLQACLMKGAYVGLDFMNKECYLVQYGSTVQFQTSYKGEVKFVKRYSIRPIKDIYAKVVRENDTFIEKIVDGRPSIDFQPLPFSTNKIVGVFAVCLYEDGGMDYETMSVEDVNSVRNNYSKMANSKPWKSSFDEMAKKTVLRRLCKHIETDFESIEARNVWEEASEMDFAVKTKPASTEVVDVFSDETEILEGEVVNE